MEHRNEFGRVRAAQLALAAVSATALLMAGVVAVRAQQLDPAQSTQPAHQATKPAAKPQPKKPPHPAAAQPAGHPAEAAATAPEQTGTTPSQQLPLVYSPWTKICGKDKQPNSKEVCLMIKEARLETGQFVAGAVLVEPEGDQKKILRVTLPLGMQLQLGTRVILDQGNPLSRPYVICFPNGCMSDYDADADMVSRMKKGQGLVVQAINAGGQPISLTLPLADFAKAYDGPPTDPKVLEEQQKKLQDELQKKAEEARKKLENQPSAQAQPK